MSTIEFGVVTILGRDDKRRTDLKRYLVPPGAPVIADGQRQEAVRDGLGWWLPKPLGPLLLHFLGQIHQCPGQGRLPVVLLAAAGLVVLHALGSEGTVQGLGGIAEIAGVLDICKNI